jgi:hypothetical protein
MLDGKIGLSFFAAFLLSAAFAALLQPWHLLGTAY